MAAEKTSQKSATSLVRILSKRYANNSLSIKSDEQYICYASKPNSLAIRSNGNLNKCTVALNENINSVGSINKDGTLSINEQNYH